MSKTKIEWTQHTWSPVTGCTKISPGCKNCYAERMARRLAGRYGYPEAPHHFDVVTRPDRLGIPLKRKKPTVYFIPSMGDLFHRHVGNGFTLRVFETMANCPQHTFQVLTKRPFRMKMFFVNNTNVHSELCGHGWRIPRPLNNVWLGVSIENQAAADARREDFRAIPAAVKFVSYEPALGPVDWSGWEFIDQLIFGGESGPGARPAHPDWFRNARDWAGEHGIARFFKQHGEWVPNDQRWHDHDNCDFDVKHLLCKDIAMARVGKKAAGRQLDGREWNQMPHITGGKYECSE